MPAGGNGVQPCGDNLFCCFGLQGCDCTNSTQTFSLTAVSIFTTLSSQAPSATTSSTSRNMSNSAIPMAASSPSTDTAAHHQLKVNLLHLTTAARPATDSVSGWESD
ncbi:hypothetical protein BJ170DRAFT_633911 [Xylariales sp. AK1849]|nr:hypothetical protein BJ170DRAFT_633911 [Xylariales sp. AK1849]